MPCYNKKGRAILIGSSPWTKTLISIRKAALVYETTGGFSYVLAAKQQYLPIISRKSDYISQLFAPRKER